MDLYWIDGPWTGQLAIFPRPRGGESLSDDVRSLKDNDLNVIVSLLTKEESEELGLIEERQFCERPGLQFLQFPIVDVSVPASRMATLELVNKLDELLSEARNVGIHCRQGVGRSGMIAACLLMMRGLSPEAALDTVSTARGVIVPQTSEQREWLIEFAREFAPPTSRRQAS